MTKKPRPWNPARPTIKGLQDRIVRLELDMASYHERNRQVEAELKLEKEKVQLLIADKRWVQQLCAELSSSVNGYMRSR